MPVGGDCGSPAKLASRSPDVGQAVRVHRQASGRRHVGPFRTLSAAYGTVTDDPAAGGFGAHAFAAAIVTVGLAIVWIIRGTPADDLAKDDERARKRRLRDSEP